MNANPTPPPPSPVMHEITPENPPRFPCWLRDSSPYAGEPRWVSYHEVHLWDDMPVSSFLNHDFTHWCATNPGKAPTLGGDDAMKGMQRSDEVSPLIQPPSDRSDPAPGAQVPSRGFIVKQLRQFKAESLNEQHFEIAAILEFAARYIEGDETKAAPCQPTGELQGDGVREMVYRACESIATLHTDWQEAADRILSALQPVRAQQQEPESPALVRALKRALDAERELSALRGQLADMKDQYAGACRAEDALIKGHKAEVEGLRVQLASTDAKATELAGTVDDLRERLAGSTAIIERQREVLEAVKDPNGGPLAIAPEMVIKHVESLRERLRVAEEKAVRLLDERNRAESSLDEVCHNHAALADERDTLRATNAKLAEAALEWHDGPARGGEGTAGKNEKGVPQWWNGDLLLIAVETNTGREYAVVSIAADEDYFNVTDASTGDVYDAWEPESWSWWAKLTKANLPARSAPPVKDEAKGGGA